MPEAVVVKAAVATKPEGVNAAFNREAVERVAAGEPGWLGELRRQAWDVYESTPLPTRRLEEWRYTDVKLLRLGDVTLASADVAVPADVRARPQGKQASARVLQAGNAPAEIWLDPALSAQGVVLADLRTAAESHRDLVEKHLATRAV